MRRNDSSAVRDVQACVPSEICMSGLAHIRNLVRQGAPGTCDELREIISVAFDGVAGQADDWRERLSAALREILVGRHL